MNYIKWNHLISQSLFNEEKADKEVRLFLTRKRIIEIGSQEKIENPWDDFFQAVIRGKAGTNLSFIENTIELFEKWKSKELNETLEYPPQIAVLAFLSLPFTELDEESFHGSNYYGRLKSFLRRNGESIDITGKHLELMNPLWEDLEDWSIKLDGVKGIFIIPDIGKKNVGKIFSQCLIKPVGEKFIPQKLGKSNFIPNVYYSKSDFQKFLLNNLQLFRLRPNKEDIKNETPLGKAIINRVENIYAEWDGNTDVIEENERESQSGYKIIKALTEICFNKKLKKWESGFRINTDINYPLSLKISGKEIYQTPTGWSNLIPLDTIRINIDAFSDEFNKWKTRFFSRNIRVYVNGKKNGLSSSSFIECDHLNQIDDFLVLINTEDREDEECFLNWAKNNCGSVEERESVGFMNWKLYKICKIRDGLDEYDGLRLFKDKSILFCGGLKLDVRSYYKHAKPKIQVENANGSESLYLEYEESKTKIKLIKDSQSSDIWNLPSDIKDNLRFSIKIKDVSSKRNYKYKLQGFENRAFYLNDSNLPKRDCFGEKIKSENVETYFQGSNIIDIKEQLEWKRIPVKDPFYNRYGNDYNLQHNEYESRKGDQFLSYLTYKQILSFDDFNIGFNFFYPLREEDKYYGLNKHLCKKYLDYLGFIDVDEKKRKIFVNQPQLLMIPHDYKGVKLLLIGGRDRELVKHLREICIKQKFGFNVTLQKDTNQKKLLPSIITINVTIKDYSKLNKVFNDSGIVFKKRVEQLGIFKLFSGDINMYREQLVEDQNPNSRYNKFLFNLTKLEYERYENNESFPVNGLVKHELNTYTRFYQYWKNGKAYEVNERWGKFLVLDDISKSVIFHNDNKVFVPIKTPLPRLLSESLALMSGLPPDNQYVKDKMYSGYYTVYHNIPGHIASNEFKKLGQIV